MGFLKDYYVDAITDRMLTEEERAEVNRIAKAYNGLDMELFIQKIGGMDKINEMRRINDAADRMRVIDGKVYKEKPSKEKEDLNEWKKGFMEGFEEAYKRLNNLK